MAEATNEFCFLYSTYPDLETARTAARLVVEKKLAACVNIYPKMTSIYMWEGKREETAEFAAFVKTRRTLVDQAMAALWEIHPYEVPCFVVLPIEAGSSDYLAWARAQTEQPVTV
ncbi:MAG TPA: divalent-cation tolerance protein CutA [Micropepsaceae bacterium]|jgi:periplasmic divalent cation tolerance protein|nr:divalent-cation tolerance protein CutA [Micropepsaceae bacterium]